MSSASHSSSDGGITITHTHHTIFSLSPLFFLFFTEHLTSKETADAITMFKFTTANYPTAEGASLEVLKTRERKTVCKTIHLTTRSGRFTARAAHDRQIF